MTMLLDLQDMLRANKPHASADQARFWAIATTEAEKLVAYFDYHILRPVEKQAQMHRVR